jgi:hypothetical protein
MEQFIEETKDALKWFKANDIVAWADSDKTSVYVEVNNDTHVLINGSEISYRADLYKNNQLKINVIKWSKKGKL